METTTFTPNDLAKYPFLKETAEYIRPLNLQISDLTTSGMEQILKRAEERVREAITSTKVTRDTRSLGIEIPSYPVALLLVAATENSFIRKRYALAEAKQASADLAFESPEKAFKIAKSFGWKITHSTKDARLPREFVLHFTDYLRNVNQLSADSKWKLVNRILIDGHVYLNQGEIVRLLEEEIRKTIDKRLATTELSKLPPEIVEVAGRLKALAVEVIGTAEMEGFPKVIVQEAFPPCINALYDAASKSRHLSHVGRFTLTSFLLNIGMLPETLAELFKSFSDFNERLTRYQIEHIAGSRGSGTRYTPPNCETLQTHGVCLNRDDICRGARNPLIYYKRKQTRAERSESA